MVSRMSRQRSVPTRKTRVRLTSRNETIRPRRTLSQIRKEQKTEEQYLKSLKDNIDSYLTSIPNIKDISKEAQKLFSENIRTIPPRFRPQFKSIIQKSITDIKNKQDRTVAEVKNNINKFKQLEESTDRKQKGKSGSSLARLKAKEDAYFKQWQEAQKILSRLKKGEILDSNKIKSHLGKVFEFEKSEKLNKSMKKATDLKYRTKNIRVNQYIEKASKTGKLEPITTIKNKFGISTKDAVDVYNITKQNTNSISAEKKRRESLLNAFSPNLLTQLELSGIDTQKSYSPEAISKIEINTLFSDVSRGQLTAFNKLNPQDRNLVLSYAVIRSARKDAPTISDVKNIRDELDILKFVTNTKKDRILTKQDENNIKNLKNLSDSQIRQILLSGSQRQINKLNSYIDSSNKYYDTKQKYGKAKLKDLMRKTEQLKLKAQLRFLVTPGVINIIPKTKIALYNATLKDLNNKLGKGNTLTLTQYTEYKDSIQDLTGLKSLTKNTISKLRKNYGQKGVRNIIKGNIKTISQFAKFLTKVSISTIKIIIRDFSALFKLGVTAGKMSAKNLMNPYRDIIDLLSAKIKKLPKSKQKELFSRTKKDIAKLKKFGKGAGSFVKTMKNNPEVLVLGLALVVSQGQRGVRKAIVNNPAKAVSEVISIFAVGQIAKGLSKGVPKGVRKIVAKLKKLKKTNVLVKKSRFATKTKIYSGIKTSLKPTKNFRYAMKTNRGRLVFLDKKSLKRIRRFAKRVYVEDFTDDMITNFVKAKRKLRKYIKLQKRPGKLSIEKERRALRKAQALDKSGKLPKALRKPTATRNGKPVWSLYDFRTGKVKEYTSRKKWFRAVKQQEKAIRSTIGKTTFKTESGRFKRLFLNKKGQARLKLILEKPKLLQKPKVKRQTLKLLRKRKMIIQQEAKVLSALSPLSPLPLKKNMIKQITNLVNTLRKVIKAIQKEDFQKLSQYLGVKLKLKTLQKSALKTKTLTKQITETLTKLKKKNILTLKAIRLLKLDSKLIPQTIKITSLKPPNKPPVKIPPFSFKINWNTKLPSGYNRIVNAIVRVKGKNRVIRLRTTPNRALNKVSKIVDNTTTRSFQLKIVGIRKKADTKKPKLDKFRQKKSKGSAVLGIVEKTKYAIDTKGEKKGLSISKALNKLSRKTSKKKRSKTTKKKKTRQKRRKPPKKTSAKRKRRKSKKGKR